MYLYVLFTLLKITHNKKPHQFTAKPRTSTETGVLSVNNDTAKTYVVTSGKTTARVSVRTSIGSSIGTSIGASIGASIGSSFGTSFGTSAGDKHCSRKDHVVYIKTHKTGSTTVSHIFWR